MSEPNNAGPGSIVCATCGAPGNPNGRFCSRCGASMSVPPAAATPPPNVPDSAGLETTTSDTPPSGVGLVSQSEMQSAQQPAPLVIHSTPKRQPRIAIVLAVVGAVVIIAAAAIGTTVILSKHTNSNGAAGTASGPAALSGKGYSTFAAEYAGVKNAVAEIKSVGCDGNNYVGSGFVINSHNIVTAGHVVEGSQSISVTVNGNPIPVHLIGLDTSGDVALLRSDATLAIPYLPLGTGDPQIGQRVAAIGFPLAGGLTMTQGSVSALNQSITVNNTNLAGLVQTDTALNPGNSGGPLIALDGHADGIVDALNTQANGIGYAIDPQYASSEVNNWIVSPESHPLPLCNIPNPLASISGSSLSPSVPSGNEASAASAVDSILQQSANARSAVVAATQSISNCASDPASQLSAMQGAVSSRGSALQRLNAIPPADLPGGAALLSDLNSALQASDQADQDFIQWMNDIEGTSCPHPSTSDSNFQAATSASTQADSAKQAFLALWNPVAAQFGLTQYTAGQI